MIDWNAYAARDWQGSTVQVPGDSAALDSETAYGAIVAAAEPFRQGTRFRAVPEVRFFGAYGSVGAPGELLPGEDDRSLKDYLQRQAEPFLLTAREPFALDFQGWAELRSIVEPLWQEIGVPIVPVSSELAIADRRAYALRNDGYVTIVLVLEGELEATLAEETVTAAAGDLLSWPAQPAAVTGSECLWLRLLIPVDGRLAARQVTELLLAKLDQLRDSGATPYLPMSDAGTTMRPLAETVERLTELGGSEVERSLRISWAKRVSAAALEPVPPPRTPDLDPGRRVRLTSPVFRVPDGERWLWAVNGHAFTVGGGDAVLDALEGVVEVRDDAYLPLLRRLQALQAVEVVE